jgi:hypothetical protein
MSECSSLPGRTTALETLNCPGGTVIIVVQIALVSDGKPADTIMSFGRMV